MKKNILVVRNDQIGDTCLTAPLFKNIKNLWPDSRLTVISSKQSIEFVKLLVDVDDVVIDFKQLHTSYSMLKLVSFLKQFKADMIFFSKMDSDYIIASRIANIKVRVGDKNNVLLNPFLSHKVNICWHDFTKHEVDQQLRLLSPFTKSFENQTIKFKENKEVKKRLFKTHFNKMNYIVIHPSFGKGNRALTSYHYKHVIESILKENNLDVVITGVQKDLDFVSSFNLNQSNRVINLVGKLSIEELLYVIKYASVVISAETGPMHLASLLKKKIINISPTKYVKSFRWGPYETDHVIIKNNKKCNLICQTYKVDCNEMYCIDSIKTYDILKSIKFLFDTSHFPEKRLLYWLKTTTTINIVIHTQSDLDIQQAKDLIDKLKSNNVSFNVIFSSKANSSLLEIESSEVISIWDIKKWIRYLSVQQMPMIHLFGNINPIWITIVKKLVALKIDLEPFIYQNRGSHDSLGDVFSDYILQSNLLSR